MTLGERLAALERDVKNVRDTDIALLRQEIGAMSGKLDAALKHVHRSQGVRTVIMAVVAPIGGIVGGIVTTLFHGRP